MRITLALTGASGIPVGVRIAEELSRRCELYTMVTDAAKKAMGYEVEDVDESMEYLQELSDSIYGEEEIEAPIASGSFETAGMVIAPCSMNTLGAVASGLSDNLVERAADVCLKEGRKLVLVPRETPLSGIHIENMLKLKKYGADIVPPVLGFYYEPKKVEDVLDHITGKVLERFGIEHDLYKKWKGDA